MHHELSLLAKSEYTSKILRAQKMEYSTWKESVRRERLDKLYEIRETFLMRVEGAKKKYQVSVQEREGRVEMEWKRRGLHLLVRNEEEEMNEFVGGSGQGDEDDDNNHDEDGGYDDDGWGGTIREDDILGEESSFDKRQLVDATIHEEDDENNGDEWSPLATTAKSTNPLGMNVVLDGVQSTDIKNNTSGDDDDVVGELKKEQVKTTTTTNKLEPISHDDNLQRKSERLQKKNQITSPTATNKQQRHEYLMKQQESIRDMLKTNEERIAEATLLKLEERLKNVDDLLESLQEEEWADEEDEEQNVREANWGDKDKVEEEATLLDQILAMILGALPMEIYSLLEGGSRKTEEEHYRYIMEEHTSIVKEWIAVFGRLPPFPSSEPVAPEPVPEPMDHNNNGSSSMPFGDGFASSEAMFPLGHTDRQNDVGDVTGVSSGGSGNNNQDLTLIGNDDSNWDEVEDWDALFP